MKRRHFIRALTASPAAPILRAQQTAALASAPAAQRGRAGQAVPQFAVPQFATASPDAAAALSMRASEYLADQMKQRNI
jgi:hypothetical protein